MGSYSGNIGQPDRTKAIAGVVAVHAALAAIILSGLNVATIRAAVEHMTTIDIAKPPPPPPVQKPPAPRPERAKQAEGAPAKAAKPTEVVAPPPKLPVPSPIVAAPIAGTGSASKSGAAVAGNGTGAGGTGSGPGGGGNGDTSRFTPARLTRNLGPRDYAVLSSRGHRNGLVPTHIIISNVGTVRDCRVLRSSGDAWLDMTVCEVVRSSLRFNPARDSLGRPIEFNSDYEARWH